MTARMLHGAPVAEAVFAAPIAIEAGHIGRVVTVVRPDGRLEQRREIERSDAEVSQVASQGGRLVQGEVSLHLKAVGRRRDWHVPTLRIGAARQGPGA